MKISVIIPVYKVEQYLDACVQSALAQTYTDLEIILVDDGSPDNCPKLCDEYSQQDIRIKVIHRQNGGLSDARNAGLRFATGEYILFLDSDDYWLDNELVAKLCRNAVETKSPDIILFSRVDYYEETNKKINGLQYDVSRIKGKSKNEVFEYLLTNQLFEMSACFLMLKRSMIIENEIFFEKGLLGEDMDWCLKMWSFVTTVGAIDCFAYCYRHRPASITTTYALQNVADFTFILNKWMHIALNEMKDAQLSKLYLGYLAFLYPTLLRNYFLVGKKDRKAEYELLKGLLPLLSHGMTTKTKQVVIVRKYVGFKISCIVFSLYSLLSRRGFSGLKLIWK
jgi:glycosyltransferase involved in cell wall biosynthesis